MIKSLYEKGKVLKDKYPEYFEPWGYVCGWGDNLK